jgi:hypothetical protein
MGLFDIFSGHKYKTQKRFTKAVEKYIYDRGAEADFPRPGMIVVNYNSKSREFDLDAMEERYADRGASSWEMYIERHLNSIIPISAGVEATRNNNAQSLNENRTKMMEFDQNPDLARSHLRIEICSLGSICEHETAGNLEVVYKEVGDNQAGVVAYDFMPLVLSITASQLTGLGGREAVWDQAVQGVINEPKDRTDYEEGFSQMTGAYASGLAADLARLIGSDDAFVAAPCDNEFLWHKIVPGEGLTIVNAMVPQMYRLANRDLGGLGASLYWWHNNKLLRLSTRERSIISAEDPNPYSVELPDELELLLKVN